MSGPSVLARLRSRIFSALTVARLRAFGEPFPAAAPADGAASRVLIAPANSAGQGFAWARALERARPDLSATSLQFMQARSARFAYPIDVPVLSGYGVHSRRWQRRQAAAVRGYRAVLLESAIPVLGGRHGGDTAQQVSEIRAGGVQIALLFHGSDLRDPDAHLAAEPDSYFSVDPGFTESMRRATRRSRELIAETGLPVFVSTPDLLREVEGATWLPVVVEIDDWASEARPFAHGGIPRVVHAPSRSHIKGSDLIDDHMTRLHDAGIIEYRRIVDVPHTEMPAIYRGADIVLDQFRGGPYGVAACEAMAAGRIVIAHVPERDRATARAATGRDLPIVESTAADLEEVLRRVIEDPEAAARAASEGPEYVRHWHDGERSGAVLAEWLTTKEQETA